MSNPKKSSNINKVNKHNNKENVSKGENKTEKKFISSESIYSSRASSHVEVQKNSSKKSKTNSSVPSRPNTRRNYKVMPNNYLKTGNTRLKINDLAKKIPLKSETPALCSPAKGETSASNSDNKKEEKNAIDTENLNMKDSINDNSPIHSQISKKKGEKVQTPRLTGAGSKPHANHDPPKRFEIDDCEYLQFSLRITEDIIRNDLYSPKQMRRVFNSHIEANRGRLNMNKMLLQIDHLCKELDIAKKSSQKDRNEKCIAYCSCQPRKCDSDSDLASQKTKDLVKKIFDGHVITDQEINDLSENELQDVISEMLNDRGENEESKIVEQDFNLILNNADNFMSASDEHFKNISPKESNETIGESPESPKDATFSPEFPKTPYQSLETFDTVLQTVIQNLAKVVEENKSIFGEQTKEGEKEVEDEESEADIEKPCSLDCISSSNEILKHSLDSDEQFKETEIIKVNLNSLGEELLNFYKEDISTEDDIIEENCAKSKEKPEIIDDENKKEEKIECSDANCAEINDPKLQPSNNFKNEVHFDEEFEQNFENVVAKDQSTTSEPDLSLVEQSSENERKEAVQLLLEYPRKLDESETTEKSSDTLEPLKTNSSTGKTDIVDELLLISESSLPEVNVVEEPYSESINEEENKEKDQIISSITKFILNKTFKTIESTGNALKTIESNGNELKTIPLKQKANTCPIDCEIQPKNDSDFVSKIEEVLFNNYKELYDCTKAQCAEKNTYKLCETNKCLANRDCKPKIPMSKYLDKYKTHCTRIIYREGARPCDEISDGEISRNSSDLSKKICVKIYKKSQPSILAHLKKYEQGTERCKINVATQCYCTSDRQLFCCCDRNKASCRRIYPAVGTQTSNSSFNITDSFRDSLLSDGEVQNTSSESSARTETSDYDSFKRRL